MEGCRPLARKSSIAALYGGQTWVTSAGPVLPTAFRTDAMQRWQAVRVCHHCKLHEHCPQSCAWKLRGRLQAGCADLIHGPHDSAARHPDVRQFCWLTALFVLLPCRHQPSQHTCLLTQSHHQARTARASHAGPCRLGSAAGASSQVRAARVEVLPGAAQADQAPSIPEPPGRPCPQVLPGAAQGGGALCGPPCASSFRRLRHAQVGSCVPSAPAPAALVMPAAGHRLRGVIDAARSPAAQPGTLGATCNTQEGAGLAGPPA